MGNRDGILEWIVATAMAMLVVIVFSQVVLRCLTYQPLAWTEEAARYIFIWLCLLGAAAAARRGQHFAVEFLVRLLPLTLQRPLIGLMLVLEATFYLCITVVGVTVIRTVNIQESPSLGISMAVPYLAIPVGALLLGLIAAHRAYSVLIKHD